MSSDATLSWVNYPDDLSISLLSLHLDTEASNLIYIKLRNQMLKLAKDEMVCFKMDFHKMLFDTLKVYVYGNRGIKVGKLKIPLNQLTAASGEFVQSFSVTSLNSDKEIGSLDLKFLFSTYTEHPMTPPSESGFSMDSSDLSLQELSLSQSAPTQGKWRSGSQSSHSSSVSVRSSRSTTSSVRYLGFSENTVFGFKEFGELKAAFFGSGWKISKYELLKSYSLVSKYVLKYRKFHHTGRIIKDAKQLEVAGYFLHFAMASYGIFLVNYFGYGNGILKDLFRSSPNKKIAMEHCKISKEHMLVWDFGHWELFRPNFFICWDERTQAIVLAVRGTLSVYESLADVICDYEPFKGGLVHKGVLRMALWLEENMLHKIKGFIKQFNAKSLFLTGHSLGGAAVCVFRMMLSDHLLSWDPDFEIKTIGFATAASVSANLCRQYESEITSYINEQDVIPRLSFGSLKDFQSLIMTASTMLTSHAPIDEKLHDLSEKHQQLLKSDVHPKLYAPGKIYFMYKTSRYGIRQTQEPHYVCEESEAENFSDCKFTEKALFHHFLDKYDNSLRKAHQYLEKTASTEDGV